MHAVMAVTLASNEPENAERDSCNKNGKTQDDPLDTTLPVSDHVVSLLFLLIHSHVSLSHFELQQPDPLTPHGGPVRGNTAIHHPHVALLYYNTSSSNGYCVPAMTKTT